MTGFEVVMSCVPEIPWVLANLFAILLGAMNLERHRVVATIVIGASVVSLIVSVVSHAWWLVSSSLDLWTTLGEWGMFAVSTVFRLIGLVTWLAMVASALLGREAEG